MLEPEIADLYTLLGSLTHCGLVDVLRIGRVRDHNMPVESI
jgi:hypothetical protein